MIVLLELCNDIFDKYRVRGMYPVMHPIFPLPGQKRIRIVNTKEDQELHLLNLLAANEDRGEVWQLPPFFTLLPYQKDLSGRALNFGVVPQIGQELFQVFCSKVKYPPRIGVCFYFPKDDLLNLRQYLGGKKDELPHPLIILKISFNVHGDLSIDKGQGIIILLPYKPLVYIPEIHLSQSVPRIKTLPRILRPSPDDLQKGSKVVSVLGEGG